MEPIRRRAPAGPQSLRLEALEERWVPSASPINFTLDPNNSTVTIRVRVLNADVQPQGPGADVTGALLRLRHALALVTALCLFSVP